MNKYVKIGGVVVVVALAALAVAAVALAQEQPPEDSPFPHGRFGVGANLRECFADGAGGLEAFGLTIEELSAAREEGQSPADLMAELGITADDIEAARAEALQQAVEEGCITQEQADSMLDRRGSFGAGGRRGGWMSRTGALGGIAETLGLSVEDFQSALAEGQSPAEVLEELGVTTEDIQAARAEAMQQAVEDGTITQEQADAMLNRSGEGLGFGGFRGFRGDNPPPFLNQ